MVLTDLHPERPTTITVCIFGTARQDAVGLEDGAVIAVIAPKLLPAKAQGAPPVCIVSKAGALVHVGQAAELGRCNSHSASGVPCGHLIWRARVDKCPTHLAAARAPPPTTRLELASSAALLPPPKRPRADGPPDRRPLGAAISSNPRARPGIPAAASGAPRLGVGAAMSARPAPGPALSGGRQEGPGQPLGALSSRAAPIGSSGLAAMRKAAVAVTPAPPVGRADAKTEVRAEFVKRGLSVGARNVVQMIAASEKQAQDKKRALERRKQMSGARAQSAGSRAAAAATATSRAGAIGQGNAHGSSGGGQSRVSGGHGVDVDVDDDDDDDDDDSGLSIQFTDADAPPKYSWQGMIRRGREEGPDASATGGVVASEAARRFFGDTSDEALAKHVAVVAHGNATRAELSRS